MAELVRTNDPGVISVIEGLLADPNALTPGGKQRVQSVMFTDLTGFTSIAERLDASMQASIDDYSDPWRERVDPVTPGQFATALPLIPLPLVPVR